MRARWDLPRQTPADLAFRITDPRRVEVSRPAGFDAGALYELTYTARDPMVLGLGFAPVRDVASFLRHERGAANPLAGQVRRGLAFGVSQSGRFLRDYLHLGFNEDTEGRQVFDGLMPHVAGSRRMFMNDRFARPDKAPRHPQDPAWPADAFPFAYAETVNPFTGERDALLRRCRLSGTCPKPNFDSGFGKAVSAQQLMRPRLAFSIAGDELRLRGGQPATVSRMLGGRALPVALNRGPADGAGRRRAQGDPLTALGDLDLL